MKLQPGHLSPAAVFSAAASFLNAYLPIGNPRLRVVRPFYVHLPLNTATMSENHIKESLKIKPVSLKYLDQYNELLRYVFQVTDRQLEESGYEDGELRRSKRPILQEAEVFGWFTPDDQLVSQICIYPCEVNIYGRIYSMGGVTGVGTYPEFAGLGLMNDLIKIALRKMRVAGQYISYLYPYSIPYYRRKGWEIMSDHITFSLKDTEIPKHAQVSGHVQRREVDDADVKDTYDRFAHATHGALLRNDFEWMEYWRWENEEERTAAVYYDASGTSQGFLLYWVEEDVFHIREMVYLTQEARKGLWNFIRAHYSMIDSVRGNIYTGEPLAFLLDESQIVETIEPYFMARIVDVEEFLRRYPFERAVKPFHFIVKDPAADWNNRIFGLSCDAAGTLSVTREAVGKAVETDIQTLSTMLMGYRRPSYLARIERLRTDRRTLRLLEEIIPDGQPYFSDYF